MVVDGVFFQITSSGIGRVWLSLFQEWARNGFSSQVVVLDRAGSGRNCPASAMSPFRLHIYKLVLAHGSLGNTTSSALSA